MSLTYITPGVNSPTGAIEAKLYVATQPLLLQQDMAMSVDIELVDGWVIGQVVSCI